MHIPSAASLVNGHFIPTFLGIPNSEHRDCAIRALARSAPALGTSWSNCPFKVAVNAILNSTLPVDQDIAVKVTGLRVERVRKFINAWDDAPEEARALFKTRIREIAKARGLTAEDDAFLREIERGQGIPAEEHVLVRA